jgi:Fe2+ transport system protein B
LLDKEKELSVQREREAAEAYEKERQANVRLQLSETLLKKKSEEYRQLAHECQLKENQVCFLFFFLLFLFLIFHFLFQSINQIEN